MNPTLLPPDKIAVLVDHAKRIIRTDVAIAEVGVFQGGSLMAMAEAKPDVVCYGFDTFAGLPKLYHGADEVAKPGEFAASEMLVRQACSKYPNIRLVTGVFPASAEAVHRDSKFALVHLDVDLWRAMNSAINWFWPKIISGGVMVIDDWAWPGTPGIEPLVTGFANGAWKEIAYFSNPTKHQAELRKL